MFSSSRKSPELDRLKAELQELKERSDLLDSTCGVGLWQAVLREADAMHPQSAWTWSDEFRHMLGYHSEAEFPNVVRSWSDRLHPDDVEPTFAAFKAHLKDRSGRARYDVTYRLKTRDGSYRWFRATGGCRHSPDGQIIRACGSLTDIHEQKEAEAAFEKERNTVIGAIAGGLAALSEGDVTHRIDVEFPPQAQRLKDDFNASAKRLHEAIGAIAELVEDMQTGVGEISDASDDLSRRTAQQAASLEETAAALSEITVTVKRTADGARQVAGLTNAAREGAKNSGEVVRKAIEAMAGIEHSSRQITQIIGVIDEIAFQTNLLALNAGVEAARAGDAGKGFAVVASEVRALAQRSAEAAKEIKGLISSSSHEVSAGVALVGQTGEALEEIVTQVAEINGLVADIAGSAGEQATGLNQVNAAVNQMDLVTQQNAAMVEQSNAASHNLAQEAQSLAALVQRFKFGGGGRSQPARRAPVPAGPVAVDRHRPVPKPAGANPVHQQRAKLAAAMGRPSNGRWEDL